MNGGEASFARPGQQYWQGQQYTPKPAQAQQAAYGGYGPPTGAFGAAYSPSPTAGYGQPPPYYPPAPAAQAPYPYYPQQQQQYSVYAGRGSFQQPVYEQAYGGAGFQQGYPATSFPYSPAYEGAGYVPQQYQPYPGVPGMSVPAAQSSAAGGTGATGAGATGGGGGGGGGAASKNRIPGASCFIFHLPPTVTEETLKQLFSTYGNVLNAYVVIDKATNRSRGYGFVDFSTPAEANAAVLGMNKQAYGGKFLAVSIKK